MITKTLYTCQFCNTDYTDKEKTMGGGKTNGSKC